MARLAPDRVSMLAERLDRLVVRWLDTLPAAGWQGTPTEAAGGLAAVATYGDRVFSNPGRMLAEHAGLLRRHGWAVSFGRTGRGRWVRLDRSPR